MNLAVSLIGLHLQMCMTISNKIIQPPGKWVRRLEKIEFSKKEPHSMYPVMRVLMDNLNENLNEMVHGPCAHLGLHE
jgi:hypothetical protein